MLLSIVKDRVDGAAAQRSARNYKIYKPPILWQPKKADTSKCSHLPVFTGTQSVHTYQSSLGCKVFTPTRVHWDSECSHLPELTGTQSVHTYQGSLVLRVFTPTRAHWDSECSHLPVFTGTQSVHTNQCSLGQREPRGWMGVFRYNKHCCLAFFIITAILEIFHIALSLKHDCCEVLTWV